MHVGFMEFLPKKKWEWDKRNLRRWCMRSDATIRSCDPKEVVGVRILSTKNKYIGGGPTGTYIMCKHTHNSNTPVDYYWKGATSYLRASCTDNFNKTTTNVGFGKRVAPKRAFALAFKIERYAHI